MKIWVLNVIEILWFNVFILEKVMKIRILNYDWIFLLRIMLGKLDFLMLWEFYDWMFF